MKFVLDTNILFSFFWKKSLTNRIIESKQFDNISPKFALKEIEKYKEEIQKKTNIKSREFKSRLSKLENTVEFIEEKRYHSCKSEAERISPDKNDTDFLALCIKEDCILWSNDKILKKQSRVKVLSTEEIISILLS